MKKEIRPGTENRFEYLKICLEMGISASSMRESTEQMRGKTEEEKERIAAQLVEELKKAQNGE